MSKSLDDIYELIEKHLGYNTAPDAADYKRGTLTEKGQNIALEDAAKTSKQLLADLHAEANDDQTRSKAMTVALTTAKFASLLTVLSTQAETRTRSIIGLTRRLLWLTIALLVATFLLAGIAFSTDQHLREIIHLYEQQQTEQKTTPATPHQ